MIVIDSSVLIAIYNQHDVHNSAAREAWIRTKNGEWGKSLLLEAVFVETVSILKRKAGTSIAVQAGRELLNYREIEFQAASELFARTWQSYQSDLTTPLSFVDTSIAIVAQQRTGGKVLTFDKGFRRVPGIVTLPGPPN
jgi:predicted nucleic acid-binding protein